MNALPNLEETLTKSSDQALFGILHHADDFRPDVVEAARRELRRRKLSLEKTRQHEAASLQLTTDESRLATESISWLVRSLVMVLSVPPICVVPLLLSERYRTRGCRKKAAECLIGIGVGWVFYGLVFMVSGPHGVGLLAIPLLFVAAAIADGVRHLFSGAKAKGSVPQIHTADPT